MKTMMKALATVATAGAAMAGVAHADDGPTFSGNVAITTDYKFRGLSQTEGSPAIQGGFDYANGIVYAGTWLSNIDLEESALANVGLGAQTELDVYIGVKPTVGPVGFDLGVIGYFYPGASEDQIGVGELDYVEGYVKGSFAVGKLALGAAAFYSPEFTAETGTAYYLEANAALPVTEKLAVSGALGFQSIDDVSGVFTSVSGPREASDDYTTWNLGATYSAYGFALDLRYVDTSIENNDLIVRDAFTTEGRADGSVIFSVKRAL